MSVPPVRSMPAKGVPTPLGRGFFSALGLTQRTRREAQRARVPWRPLRQRLCDLCVEMSDAIARPQAVTLGACPRSGTVAKSKERILAALASRPEWTTADLVRETGLSRSGIERNLRLLKAEGRLRRVGADNGGTWQVLGNWNEIDEQGTRMRENLRQRTIRT